MLNLTCKQVPYLFFNPLSTDVTYMTFHPYVVRRLFLAKPSCRNACNWRQAQADERG